MAATARRLLDELTAAAPALVPDWAAVAPTAAARWRRAARAAIVGSGFEAGRAYVQLAVDCDAGGRAVAARAWPFFAAAGDGRTINAAYRLDGRAARRRPPTRWRCAAAAASAAAAGDPDAADELLDAPAPTLDRTTPTYYGAAWLAHRPALARHLRPRRLPPGMRATLRSARRVESPADC